MSADRCATRLARLTGRRYNEARLAIRWMEWQRGYSTWDAAEWLLSEWTLAANLEDLAKRAPAVSAAKDTTP